MAEKYQNRKAYENIVRRVVEHTRLQGKEPNERQIRRDMGEIARTRDAQHETGDSKNRAKK